MNTPEEQMIEDADAELIEIAKKIGGWDPPTGGSLQFNIKSMADTLFGIIKDRDTRIQNLQLKLGQAAEKL